MEMPFLELAAVSKGYGEGLERVQVFDHFNLRVKKGEFVAIIGFSGTGKTTLISLIAGLTRPDDGDVALQGKIITSPGPDRGTVFQNYSLLPWLTVQENIALAVDNLFPGWSPEEREAHTLKYIEKVHLSHALGKRPGELSGGMRQRVSVARALAMNPEILLLDEPLSALDALTRGSLQKEIAQIWSQEKKTVVMITNDVDEGLILADRIIPLKPGSPTTLGPEFEVPFPRPRKKTSLNHDPEYKKLRNEIIQYLLEAKSAQDTTSTALDLPLPELQPVMPGTRPSPWSRWTKRKETP